MEYALVPSPFGIWRTMSNYEEEGEEEEERIASQWRSFVTMIHGQVNAAYSESKKSFITPRSWRYGDHDSRPRFACCASPLSLLVQRRSPWISLLPPSVVFPKHDARRGNGDGNHPSGSVEEAWNRGSPRWPSPRASFTPRN